MRHGKPTVHKAFDEATAVLAGDALHALAFEVLVMPEVSTDPFVRSELVAALAGASGANGMAGGQMMDIAVEGAAVDLRTVTRLQQLKTGALLAAAVEMGAILGKVPEEGRAHLRAYARDIGLAFQIADDLLDARGDSVAIGKVAGRDVALAKSTYPGLLGLEQAERLARDQVEVAIDALASAAIRSPSIPSAARRKRPLSTSST
jgi:farnesyl diphosphate synthase